MAALETLRREAARGGRWSMREPLREVGSLPIAWPYLGKDVYPLHWRLSQIYRAMLPSLVAEPAPHLRASAHAAKET